MRTGQILTLAFVTAAIVGAVWWLNAPNGSEQYSAGGSGTAGVAEGAAMVEVQLPETFSAQAQIGQRGFEALCVQCHGENAGGRQGIGPPLVHRIYEPSHHADAAFLLAAQNGVRAHHWSFGNMPPVEGVTRADVMAITAYVRELQRANGIN